jgi:hypothetical protein
LTLCEREYEATMINGESSWDIRSTDYGERFQSISCWKPKNSAKDVVLTSPDGGLTRLNETERAFCPIENWSYILGGVLKGSDRHRMYNLTHSWKYVDNAPFKPTMSLKELMTRYAAGLTDFGLNLSNHNAIGKAYLPEVTVQVRWQWIALPALLELATVVLFLSTVFYSRHVKVPIWKSSLLAICYHNIEDLQETRAVALLSQMDKVSSTTSVQISESRDNRGFMLRRVRGRGGRREGWDQE